MIYIDALFSYGPRGEWAHLATDGDPDELHAFAQALGLRRSWYQAHPLCPHYNVRGERLHTQAVQAGAVLVSTRDLLNACRIDRKPDDS